MIIPTLIFIFGVGAKLAGTASLIISLPTVGIGIFRYYRAKTIFNRSEFFQLVVPTGIDSMIGSILGGLLYGLVSSDTIKIFLGIILIISAMKIFINKNNEYILQRN